MIEAVLDREQLANFTIVRPEPKEKSGSALGRRANIALGSLESGNSVLTIGADILSSDQRGHLAQKGVLIIDEADITEEFVGPAHYDIIMGRLETDDLYNTLPTIASMAADHADLFIDIYSPEAFDNNDALDDQLRAQDLYLRGTQADSRKDTYSMQVDAIRNPRGEISKGIRRSSSGVFYTNPTWDMYDGSTGEIIEK